MPKTLDIEAELRAMEAMKPQQLRDKYLEVWGEPTRSGNKRFMIKRIAWRLQANAEGDLPERVRRRALELARDSDLRTTPPKNTIIDDGPVVRRIRTAKGPDRPMPGTQLTRPYKGRTIVVTVLTDGYEYDGRKYRSLTAVAKDITGSHVSGVAFFNLNRKERSS
jgi:hypothetical protein